METPILTPMQLLLQTANDNLNSSRLLLDKEPNNAYIAGKCAAYEVVIDDIINHLPKEQEAIEQAGDNCQIVNDIDCDCNIYFMHETGKEYFNQTYK